MKVQVSRWGNSLGVRIPGFLAKELGLEAGSEVDLRQVDGELVLRPVRNDTSYSLTDLLATVTAENIHLEADLGTPKGRESW